MLGIDPTPLFGGHLFRLCALLLVLVAAPAAAQYEDAPLSEEEQEERAAATDQEGSIFTIKRIELSAFGGWYGGATILDLPPVAPETNDLGATDILDYSGDPLGTPIYPGQIDAPVKELENGWMAGMTATFFLSDAFGLEILGAYGKTEASITGQYLNPENVEEANQENPHPFYDPSQLDGRFEWDRSSTNFMMGGINMIYIVGQRKLRPFVHLGFGGILNSFPDTDDTGALYFQYGGGLRYPVTDTVSLKLSLLGTLFTWDQEEVARNETITYPMATLGLVWRYDVPAPKSAAPAAEEGGEAAGPQG